MDFKKLIDKYFKTKKNLLYYMVIVVLVGVLLMLVGSTASDIFTAKKDKSNAIQVSTETSGIGNLSSYEESLKKELTSILSEIKGVGKVSVMVKIDEDIEEIPAKDIDKSVEKVEEKDSNGGTRVTTRENYIEKVVQVSNGSGGEVMVIRRIKPKIGGVIVVAEGAENRELRTELLRAVQTVLNVTASKVTIHPMKK